MLDALRSAFLGASCWLHRPGTKGGGLPRLGALLAAAAALSVPGCARPAASPPRPDVLLVVIDTLRADRLGTYGYSKPTSPHIDRFARRAVVFQQALSPAPFTMPAMASLMTGLYPDRTGVINHSPRDRLAPTVATLAERARAAGYQTAAVVSNPWLANRAMGFARGFSTYVNRFGTRRQRPSAAQVTAAASRILTRRNGRPLFLWVHYIDTHMAYRPPARFARLLAGGTRTTRIIEEFSKGGTARQRVYFDPPFGPEEIAKTRALYDAAVRYVDREVGRLLRAWRHRPQRRQSIVVVTADHGESLGEHGLYFAHDFTLYEELLRVPLLVRAPGVRPRREGALVSLTDLAPTLCSWMRLNCRDRFDGEPLPLASSPGAGAGRILFAASAPMRRRYDRCPWLTVPGPDGRWTMARSATAKVIRIPQPGGPRWLAFDLVSDPREENPLGERDPRLVAALQAWRETLRRSRPPRAATAALPPETREALRSLGYLDYEN